MGDEDNLGGLSLDDGDEEFTLMSKDDKPFKVQKKHIMISKLIQTTVESGTST